MRGIVTAAVLSLLTSFAFGDGDELFRRAATAFQSEPETAYPLFLEAAEAGNVSGMVGAGRCLEIGIGTKQDFARAIEWYEKAVGQNNLKACEALARIYASCPNPEFHDGEKAVKYGEVLVRKNPRDPQSFALLAAAQARHLEFDQAVRYIGKAASLESRPDESALLEVRRAAYREGEPFPPVATESWMLAAVDKQLHWAIDRMLWKLSEQTHPDYNPDLAIQVCRGLVEEGDRDKYYLLGNLYLNMGRLDEAMDCFNLFNDSRMQGKTKEKHRDMDHYRMIESEDLERMLQIAEKIEKGFTESFTQSGDPDPFYGSRETYTVSRQNPANLKGAYFIYRIAAQKGSQVAREKVDEIEYNRAAYRRIIDNEKKLSNKAVARALEVEAKKFMQGMELPEDGELALGIFLEAYLLDPLPDYAAFIGELSVRNKGVKEAIRWWEIAAEGKILTAYTSLLRYYACAEDDGLLNPEKAMRYARAYVDAAPESAEAQSYLACAYARDGKFPRATQIMEDVLKQSEDTSLDIKERYEKQYRFFKSRKPWVWEE